MAHEITIGPHRIKSLRPGMPVLTLAPMAGISNWPFRLICAKMGAQMVGVEFINCNAILHKNPKTLQMMNFCDADIYRDTGMSLLAAQIYGNDIGRMVEGARVLEEKGAQIMDINFGCSVPKILRSDSGAAFLKDIDRMMNAVRSVADAVSIPVIIKTRLGWDHDNISILEVVKRAADSGAHAVAVHARTVAQKFNGTADWSWIARAVEGSPVPIFGNGDVFTYQDAVRMVDETGCAGVMIARAARDNPYIFSGDVTPTFSERVRLARDHLGMMVEYKGEKVGVMEMRKFFASYFKGFPNASHLRTSLVQVDTVTQAHRILDDWVADSDRHSHDA
ncbi:MAG: tRNA dihydrouridine synthase DusB [Gemmatimonadetes bacterium]|nr:tRNA dihydrouridine synthase DusB [Gemmatimonadota bacterium]